MQSKPIFDGLMYNPKLLYAPARFLPMAMEELEPYRTGKYQVRCLAAPFDATEVIAAGDTVNIQLRIVPNSAIIAVNFAMLTDGASNSDIQYMIQDSGDEVFFVDGRQRFLYANNLTALSVGGIPVSGSRLNLLTKPYVIPSSLLSVFITNRNVTSSRQCQILIYTMEPKFLASEEKAA